MKKWFIIIGVVINLIGVNSTFAQFNLNNISANIGIIKTIHNIDQDDKYVVYPEVQVDSDILNQSIRWTVYWGYWTDGINQAFIWPDYVTYSYNSHIVGTRLTLLLGKSSIKRPLQIGIFTGISHHFISVKYIGGFGLDGRPGPDYTAGATTLEVGLNAEVQVLEPIGIRGGIHQFIALGSTEYDRMEKNRRAITVGIFFAF